METQSYTEKVRVRDAIKESIKNLQDKLSLMHLQCDHSQVTTTRGYETGGYDYRSRSYLVDHCDFCGKKLQEHSIEYGTYQ